MRPAVWELKDACGLFKSPSASCYDMLICFLPLNESEHHFQDYHHSCHHHSPLKVRHQHHPFAVRSELFLYSFVVIGVGEGAYSNAG